MQEFMLLFQISSLHSHSTSVTFSESSEKTETTGRDALKRLQSIEFMLNSRLVSVSSDASQHQTAEEELVYHHTPSKVSLTPLKDDDASGYGGDGFSSKCSPTSPGGSMACTPEKSSTTFRIDLQTGEEDYLRFGHKRNLWVATSMCRFSTLEGTSTST